MGVEPQKDSTTISLSNEASAFVDQVRRAVPGFDFSLWVAQQLRAAGV